MNLEELRTVQSEERRRDSLQHLEDSFYEDVAEYIRERKAERSREAERAEDPFSSPAVSRLTDEIETAEEVVEAIYERRVGKVVKLASFAAADMPVETDGLTTRERELFEDLVARIETNKTRVLDVLSGERAAGNSTAAKTPGDAADGDVDVDVDPPPAVDNNGVEPASAGGAGDARQGGAVDGRSEPPNGGASDILAESMGGETGQPPGETDGGRTDGTRPGGKSPPDDGARRDRPAGESADDGWAGLDGGPTEAPDAPDEGGARESNPRAGDTLEETQAAGGSPETGRASESSDTGREPDGSEGLETGAPGSAGALQSEPGGSETELSPGQGRDSPRATGVEATASSRMESTPAGDAGSASTAGTETSSATASAPERTEPPAERTTVRITGEVGSILGVDEREYDLAPEDVVTLPAENAAPLLDRGAAERID